MHDTGQKAGDAKAAQADEAAPLVSEPAAQPFMPELTLEPALASPPSSTLAIAGPVTAEPAVIAARPKHDIAPALPLPAASTAQPAALAATPIQAAVKGIRAAINASIHALAPAAPVLQDGAYAATLDGAYAATPSRADPTDPGRITQVRPETVNLARPDKPIGEAPKSEPETTPLVIQSGLTTSVVLVPRIQPHIGDLTKLQSMASEPVKSGEAATQIALQQVLQAPEDRTARLIAARLPDSPEISSGPAALARPEPVAIGDPESSADTPRAALAPQQAEPLLAVPLFSADLAAAPATAPAAGAIQSPATPRTPDFAALIDRLVEARQAAQTTHETHTVNAAVNHAEFGQVSLQFRHDAAGLSVVMASADPDLAPDLARAMQVAAPANGQFSGQFGGQFGSSGEGNAPSPRQDAIGQQSASTSQAQSQGQQQRGHSPQRAPDQAHNPANSSSRPRSPANLGARSGIFA